MTQFMVSSHCILLLDMIGCDAMSECQENRFALNRILQSIPDNYSIYLLKDDGNLKKMFRAQRGFRQI